MAIPIHSQSVTQYKKTAWQEVFTAFQKHTKIADTMIDIDLASIVILVGDRKPLFTEHQKKCGVNELETSEQRL